MFNPWVGKIPGRSKWLATSVFLPGEFHGQRNLAGYSPWGSQRDTTEQLTCSLFSRTEAIIAPKPRAVPARVEIPNLPKEEAERRREKGMEEWAWQGATWAFLSRTNPCDRIICLQIKKNKIHWERSKIYLTLSGEL